MLNDEELLRYSRHILLPEVDVKGQLSLKKARVLIVGLGGLGSAVAQYLAASGVGTLVLVDHDIVEVSNLQRQVIHRMDTLGQTKVDSAKSYIENLNPEVNVVCLDTAVNEDNIADHFDKVDLVVDCCDNFVTRKLVNRTCLHLKKILVSGAAIRMEAQVTVFDFRDSNSPCYQCLYELTGNENLSCSQSGVLSPLVGITGSIQALETLKLIMSIGKSLVGRVQFFDAKNSQWREFKLKKDPNCKLCSGP